jgi:hypothetical protein
MEPRRFLLSLLAAAVPVQPAPMPRQNVTPPAPESAPLVPRKKHEWHHLQGSARTCDEFQALSRWCRTQADECRKQLANCEAELREYMAHPPVHPFPRNPRRDDVLRTLVGTYKTKAAKWSALSDAYSHRAQELQSLRQH